MTAAKKKLEDLSRRAAAIKADPSKRHFPNEHDTAKVRENASLMQQAQYQAIKSERDGA